MLLSVSSCVAVGCLLVVVLVAFVMKQQYGTLSFRSILAKYKRRKELESAYTVLFDQRDNLMYHIEWARSRGDFEDAAKMMKDLDRLDKDIDKFELALKDDNATLPEVLATKPKEC